MTQKVKIQDGVVVYSGGLDDNNLDFKIKGTLEIGDGIGGLVSTDGGSISIQPENIDRVTIGTTGDIRFSGEVGAFGQVLTSSGPGAPPTWQDPPVSSQAITINTQSDDYTLQLSDAYNTLIRMTKATDTFLTIPNDSNIDMPIGSAVLISWNGLGKVTIVGEVGVTIDTPDTYNIGKQFGKITAIKTEANHWEIEGNLEPA